MKKVILVSMAVLAAFLMASCVEKASGQDIDAMCARLVELRKVEDPAEAEKTRTECKAEADRDGTSKEKAQCRVKAEDVDTYWNKCR